MEILLDEKAGFCFGVKRSVELILANEKKGKKIQVLGELIHNKDFIEDLKNRGIETVERPEDLNGDIVVIRAHGAKKEIEADIRLKFEEVIDATCPFVKKIHKLAQKYSDEGYQIILLGEKDHAEVVGILSYAPNAIVIESFEEIPSLPSDTKIALISQTTQNYEHFVDISQKLKNIYQNVSIENTICDSTGKKQESARQLAQKVDLMIVIGGMNSCNTKNLAEISSEYVVTHHIERAEELSDDWLLGKDKIGITAGASTPDYLIDEVIDKIYKNSKKEALC